VTELAGVAFEFEEPQPVAASHLLRCRCSMCGGEALAAPERVGSARCTACMGGGVVAPWLAGRYTPGRQVQPLPGAGAPVVAGLAPHPAPEIPAHVLQPAQIDFAPSAVRTLTRVCTEHGWAVRVQMARGNGVHGGTGRPTECKDRWGVTFGRDGWQGYAVYGGTWESVCVLGRELRPKLTLSVTDLRHWLTAPADPGRLWYEHVEAAAWGRVLGTKKRPGGCPGGLSCLLVRRWLLRALVLPETLFAWPDGHEHRANGDIKPIKQKAKRESGG
jgi:hypothetical protein